METNMVELGSATYEIQRSFEGKRPAAELIRERLAKQPLSNSAVSSKSVDVKPVPVIK